LSTLKAKYRVDDNIIYHWTNHDLQLRPLFQSQHSFLQAGTGLSRLNTSQGPRFTHAHFKSMTVRQLYQLAQVGNEELERQCASGRARALDGDRGFRGRAAAQDPGEPDAEPAAGGDTGSRLVEILASR
jgi:hypothetical protein